MATENPFYMWSLAEAWDLLVYLWDWLVHVPVVGFVLLAVLGLFVLVILLAIHTRFLA